MILVKSAEGTPLIKDPKKPEPIYWKLPGGRSEPGESAEEAAVREIKEELGLKVTSREMTNLFVEDRETHNFALFEIKVDSLKDLKKNGDEGEEIKVFSLDEISKLKDFFFNHKVILRRLKIIS